ncbi:MAG: DUF3306 domain-containing protein [Alsobacter sp.]
MSDTSGFLTRWSQRKRAAADPASAPVPGENDPAAQDAATIPQEDRDAGAALPEMPPLPSLEEISASTDISMFMHPAVPEPLRAAALRRMWAIDPAIRDFVSEAVDYAYDWNTPDGVPGNGPLGPADDVARMIADLFDRPDPEAAQELAPEGTPETEPHAEHDTPAAAAATPDAATPFLPADTASLQSANEPTPDRDLRPQGDSSGHRPDMSHHLVDIGQAYDLQPFSVNLNGSSEASDAAEAPPAGPRRHGGALPA